MRYGQQYLGISPDVGYLDLNNRNARCPNGLEGHVHLRRKKQEKRSPHEASD